MYSINGLKKRWVKILIALVDNCGEASFSQLKEKTKIPSSTLAYILNTLKRENLIISTGRGKYKLKFFTPFMFLNIKYSTKNLAYFGLLGLRMGREQPEYKIALRELEYEGYNVVKIVVATTLKALSSWGEDFLENIEICLLKEGSLFNPIEAEKNLNDKVVELIKNYPLVVDITSGPRVAALALYKLCNKYSIPVIYIREDNQQLIWIKSINEIILQDRNYS